MARKIQLKAQTQAACVLTKSPAVVGGKIKKKKKKKKKKTLLVSCFIILVALAQSKLKAHALGLLAVGRLGEAALDHVGIAARHGFSKMCSKVKI